MIAIEIRNLVKVYKGKKRNRVEALKGITFDIGMGEVFGFLGPNGAGKSTTIKIIMDLIRPTTGEVTVFGHKSSSPAARRQVGYLPENPAFYDFLSADEYLNFVGQSFNMTQPLLDKKKDEVLSLLEISKAGKRPLRGYSKGMVQRLGLAQVLLHDPDIYILDEPMSGLDPLGRALVKDIILDLKHKGKCVFFSTHITEDVENVCDRVGIIINGELKRVEVVETMMMEGIHGYRVISRNRATGEVLAHFIEKNNLSQFLVDQQSSGVDVTLVEPKRRNLEDFFLQIVKGE